MVDTLEGNAGDSPILEDAPDVEEMPSTEDSPTEVAPDETPTEISPEGIPEGLDIAALKAWFSDKYSLEPGRHFLVDTGGVYSVIKDGEDLGAGRIVVVS